MPKERVKSRSSNFPTISHIKKRILVLDVRKALVPALFFDPIELLFLDFGDHFRALVGILGSRLQFG